LTNYSKTTRIEIYTLTPEGLEPCLDIPIYGRLLAMELFKVPNRTTDFLFFLTERYKFCVISYDTSTKQLVTEACGDLTNRSIRSADFQTVIINPECTLMVLHLFAGSILVIQIDESGILSEAYNIG
jgi:DNA damage-binding protein 1